ncbi:hypothetical protein EI94DRAFT_1699833 [Lactarius quietus]|nr:hypothetical protein EI94DRAFT_1699833 [Lactarius quietus]
MSEHRDKETLAHYRDWYTAALAFCPQLEACLKQGDAHYISMALKEGMCGAHSSDAHHLKELAGRIVEMKSDHGFNHSKMGQLLIPVQHIKEYDMDLASTRAKVNASNKCTIPKTNFMGSYEDILSSACILLTTCFHVIFLGRSTSLQGPAKRPAPAQSGLAGIYGVLSMTVPMIAYAVMQACFALSSQQTWNGKDGKFSYEEFYKTLIQIFKLGDKWREETLAWWNIHRNGLASSRASAEASDGILAKVMSQVAKHHTEKAADEEMATDEEFDQGSSMEKQDPLADIR